MPNDNPGRWGHVTRSLAIVLATIAALLSACAGSPDGHAAAAPGTNRTTTALKVAWVNQGRADDEVWTRAHAAGAQAVADTFGNEVETTFVENVAPGSDAPRVIEDLIAEGNSLIFTTSFGFSEDMVAAAKEHPDISFGQARGLELLDNLGTFSGADEEPIYLAGMAAASISHTNRLGFVATVVEPETVRHVNAFTLGARSVSPDVVVEVSWIGSWWAPEHERALAEELIGKGADVVATGSISTATGEAARDLGVRWVGHDADHAETFPDEWVTGAVPDWTGYYIEQVRAALEGSWSPEAYYGDMADGFTDVASFGRSVPADVQKTVVEARDSIVRGHLDIFAGPISDQSGRRRVAAGETMSMDERMSLDWLVEGVVGDLPAG